MENLTARAVRQAFRLAIPCIAARSCFAAAERAICAAVYALSNSPSGAALPVVATLAGDFAVSDNATIAGFRHSLSL